MDDLPGPATSGERAVDVAMLTKIEGELADVERALGRLDDGTYGTCEVCGAAIPDSALALAPTRSTCDEHAPAS